MRCVIDPGHSGTDPGAVHGNYHEADLALQFALMLGHFLREKKLEVVFTRTESVPLEDKVRRSVTKQGDILVSCHMNAVANPSANGLSIWYRGGMPESKELADKVFKGLMSTNYIKKYSSGTISDKTRYTTGFYMLRYAEKNKAKSCILMELGFISNDNDRKVMTTTELRNKLAKETADAIEEYINANKG